MALSEILKTVPKVTFAAAYGSAVMSQVEADIHHEILSILIDALLPNRA